MLSDPHSRLRRRRHIAVLSHSNDRRTARRARIPVAPPGQAMHRKSAAKLLSRIARLRPTLRRIVGQEASSQVQDMHLCAFVGCPTTVQDRLASGLREPTLRDRTQPGLLLRLRPYPKDLMVASPHRWLSMGQRTILRSRLLTCRIRTPYLPRHILLPQGRCRVCTTRRTLRTLHIRTLPCLASRTCTGEELRCRLTHDTRTPCHLSRSLPRRIRPRWLGRIHPHQHLLDFHQETNKRSLPLCLLSQGPRKVRLVHKRRSRNESRLEGGRGY